MLQSHCGHLWCIEHRGRIVNLALGGIELNDIGELVIAYVGTTFFLFFGMPGSGL